TNQQDGLARPCDAHSIADLTSDQISTAGTNPWNAHDGVVMVPLEQGAQRLAREVTTIVIGRHQDFIDFRYIADRRFDQRYASHRFSENGRVNDAIDYLGVARHAPEHIAELAVAPASCEKILPI
ncbi:hypothetical protein COL27_29800, partial [Bacillus sp. AFS075960]